MNPSMNNSLTKLRLRLEDHATPGESGAENESDVWEGMDLYVSGILDDLLESYELTDDEALDFLFTVADDQTSAGKMPVFPDDDAAEEAVSLWLGTAKTIGFHAVVMKAAEAAAE